MTSWIWAKLLITAANGDVVSIGPLRTNFVEKNFYFKTYNSLYKIEILRTLRFKSLRAFLMNIIKTALSELTERHWLNYPPNFDDILPISAKRALPAMLTHGR